MISTKQPGPESGTWLRSGSLNRLRLKLRLTVAGALPCPSFMPSAIGSQLPRLDVVRRQHIKDMEYPLPHRRVKHRTGHLDPALGIAGHKVGGGNIKRRVLSPPKPIDTGMFQITPHDGKKT